MKKTRYMTINIEVEVSAEITAPEPSVGYNGDIDVLEVKLMDVDLFDNLTDSEIKEIADQFWKEEQDETN